MEHLIDIFKHSAMITVFVFVMMMLVDYINVLTSGRMSKVIKGGQLRQYVVACFLGATPGCLGAFMNVTFYVHGLLTLGAIVGGMIATCGDEAFVMLAMFPGKALLIFAILFVLGIISSWIVDKAAQILRIKPCDACQLSDIHIEEECRCLGWREALHHLKKISFARFLLLALLMIFIYGFCTGLIGSLNWDWQRITFISLLTIAIYIVVTVPEHYLEHHIWNHIGKEHLWKIFLWTFGALLIIDMGLRYWDIESFVESHMLWVLLIAVLTAMIPQSGPHFIFVMLFADGLIPFSVLLASSIVQDGHGMLPLLSYTIRDSVLIKLFKVVIGLAVGLILFKAGL